MLDALSSCSITIHSSKGELHFEMGFLSRVLAWEAPGVIEAV
jgi:hypothetical protein